MNYRILEWNGQSGSQVDVKQFDSDADALAYIQTLGANFTAEARGDDGAFRVIASTAI